MPLPLMKIQQKASLPLIRLLQQDAEAVPLALIAVKNKGNPLTFDVRYALTRKRMEIRRDKDVRTGGYV